jgi:hypothetical protein
MERQELFDILLEIYSNDIVLASFPENLNPHKATGRPVLSGHLF